MRASIIAASLLATPVMAQQAKVWTPAPTAGTSRNDGAPADRAGSTSSADSSTPFSAVPAGARGDGGRNSPATDGNTPGVDVKTPNLSK